MDIVEGVPGLLSEPGIALWEGKALAHVVIDHCHCGVALAALSPRI